MSRWVEHTLDEISEKMFSGGTPSTSKDEYYGGDIPWVRTQEVNFNYINNTAIKISELGFNNSSARWVPSDSVIIAMYGNSAGRVAFSNIKVTTNQACCNFIANKEKSFPKFVFFNLLYRYKEIESMSKGAAQKNLNVGMLKALEINLPPLPTQRKIAKILSNYDDLIENNLKRIKLLEESARLTYEEWFLRFRIDGKKLEINPDTKLPFGWGLVELGGFLKFKKGKKADEIFEEKKDSLIKLLLLSGLESGEYTYVEKARHVIACRGDILMTMDGARSSVVFYSEDGAVGSTMSLVETGKLPKSYLYHFFKSTYEWLEINNTGAAIPHANKSFINKMKIINPGDEILAKWSKSISHINDQVFNLKDQNQLLKEARDILLPRLMTGMIDTDDMDIAI